MPAATAAAEPLLEPPGVRPRFHGLRVPRGTVAANSVVTVLPTMTAPASRRAATQAASFSERQPANSGEPISVGMSTVSMMSLMPTGMPSIGDSGAPVAPARRGAVGALHARRRGRGSRRRRSSAPSASSSARQRSRKSRGVSLPDAEARRLRADRAASPASSWSRAAWSGLRELDRGGAALARDHRGAQQELTRARRVGRDCAQLVEIASCAPPDRSLPAASCWRSTAPARTRPRPCGAADRRGRAAGRTRHPAGCARACRQRLTASWMPPLSPMPPIGLLTWAASPASSTRPLRKVAATR